MKEAISKTFKHLKPSKPFLDRIMGKFVSRKFLTWVVATIFVVLDREISTNWLAITSIFIGSETLLDFVSMRLVGSAKASPSVQEVEMMEQMVEEHEPDSSLLIKEDKIKPPPLPPKGLIRY